MPIAQSEASCLSGNLKGGAFARDCAAAPPFAAWALCYPADVRSAGRTRLASRTRSAGRARLASRIRLASCTPLGEPHPLGWSHVPSEPHPLGRIRLASLTSLASLTRSAGRIRLASCARSSGGAACNFGLLFMASFPRVSTLQGDGGSSYSSKLSINDSIRLFLERASVFQGNTASYKVEILKKLAIFRAAASIDEQVWQRGLMLW